MRRDLDCLSLALASPMGSDSNRLFAWLRDMDSLKGVLGEWNPCSLAEWL